MGAGDARAERAWTRCRPISAATNGVTSQEAAGRLDARLGPNPPLTTYTVTATTTSSPDHRRPARSAPDPSLPRGGPGRDAYGHFRVTGIRVERHRPKLARIGPSRSPSRPIKVDDSAIGVRAGRAARRRRRATRERAGRGRSTRCATPTRSAARRARPATPFGFERARDSRSRIDHLDGTIGQGIGRFRLSATIAPIRSRREISRHDFAPVLTIPAAERTTTEAEELARFSARRRRC